MRVPAALAFALVLLIALTGGGPARGQALDVLPASGSVSITTVLGSETVALSGTVTVEHGEPYIDGDRPAIDTEIVAMNLSGTSVTGPVSVAESATLASTGQVRALFAGTEPFPATGSFDAYLQVTVPASPGGTMTLHNDVGLEVGSVGPIISWPSTTTFAATPAPCLPFVPTDPLHLCVDDVSFTLTYEPVGGVAGAPELRAEPKRAERDDDAGAGADVAAGLLAAAVAVGGAGWAALRRRAG